MTGSATAEHANTSGWRHGEDGYSRLQVSYGRKSICSLHGYAEWSCLFKRVLKRQWMGDDEWQQSLFRIWISGRSIGSSIRKRRSFWRHGFTGPHPGTVLQSGEESGSCFCSPVSDILITRTLLNNWRKYFARIEMQNNILSLFSQLKHL